MAPNRHFRPCRQSPRSARRPRPLGAALPWSREGKRRRACALARRKAARRGASGAGSGREEEEEEAVMAAGPGPRICEGECAVLKRGDVFKAVAVLRRR